MRSRGRRRRHFVNTVVKRVGQNLNNAATYAAVSDTETLTTLFTGTDAPGATTDLESGAKILNLFVEGSTNNVRAARFEWLLYINPRGNIVNSGTPIADYTSNTYPTSAATRNIKRMKLAYRKMVVVSSAFAPPQFRFKLRFPRGLTINEATTLVLAMRKNDAQADTLYFRATCSYIK